MVRRFHQSTRINRQYGIAGSRIGRGDRRTVRVNPGEVFRRQKMMQRVNHVVQKNDATKVVFASFIWLVIILAGYAIAYVL